MTLHFTVGALRRTPAWHPARTHQVAASHTPCRTAELSRAELRRAVAAMID